MPFEDVALHALLLSSHSAGASASNREDGTPSIPTSTPVAATAAGIAAASPLIHKQRVAQLYAQSLAKRSEWASSLNVRSFSGTSSSRNRAGGPASSSKISGPKAPRSWESPSSGALGAGRNCTGSSSRGTMLETIAAAAAEVELEAEAVAASSSSSSTPSRAAQFYDSQFLRPSPTSLSHADMRIGSAARLAAASELQPEWRRLSSQHATDSSLSNSGAPSSPTRGKGKAKEDVIGLDEHDEGPRSGERALVQLLAVRFRRLACLGMLDVFQHGTQPNDQIFIEQGLQARIVKEPMLSLVDMCLIRLIEAFEPVRMNSGSGKTSSRRRRRKATGSLDEMTDLGTVSTERISKDGYDTGATEDGQRTEEYHFVQDSIHLLPPHLKARATALIGRLACVNTPHAEEFLLSLSYGSQTLKSHPSQQVRKSAPDDWEAEEAMAELILDSPPEGTTQERSGRGNERSQMTELDLSFIATRPETRNRLLDGYFVENGFASSLRTLSLAGLNQPDLQLGNAGRSIDVEVSPNEILKIVQLLPVLEVLSLAGSCLPWPAESRVRTSASRRGVIPESTSNCASCDQVFAAALGDMMYDVTLDHPQPPTASFLVRLAKATPKLTVLDLSATCWVDDHVLEQVPWISVPADSALPERIDEEASQSLSRAIPRRRPSHTDSTWTDVSTASPSSNHASGAHDQSSISGSRFGDFVASSNSVTAQVRGNPIWPRLERLLLRGCPHLITSPPPCAILPEWPELDEMIYTKKRYLEQRKDIILTARNRRRADLSRKVRGQVERNDPAVRWTEIIWDY